MATVHRFGPFCLDGDAEMLFCGAEPTALGRRAIALLRLLLERAGTPVSKDALIEAAWPGLAIEENNLTVQIAALRRVFQKAAGGETWIETLPRRGYRYVGPAVITDNLVPDTNVQTSPASRLSIRPSIAVLPFQNLSGDPEQEYFADGMVDEIITALSRIRWLLVIARNSTFAYKGQTVNLKHVGRELGVRYLLEGSVRKGGDQVRITAQLIEAETGTHLWVDRFDGSMKDVFKLQDDVAISVAGVIEPALQTAEAHRSSHCRTDDLTAYDLYLRALPKFASLSKDGLGEALDLLNRAIARDPFYGPALALGAMCTQQLHLGGWMDGPKEARNQGVDYARRAIRAAESDPFVLASAAYAFGYFGEDMGAALALMDRALMANPGSAYGWFWSGTLRMLAGQHDTAIEHMQTSLRLNPRDRLAAPLTLFGAAYFFKREFGLAAANLQASLQERPGFAMTYRFLAACNAHMGELDEARKIIQLLRTVSPVVLPAAVPFRKAEDRDLFLSGLRLAVDKTA